MAHAPLRRGRACLRLMPPSPPPPILDPPWARFRPSGWLVAASNPIFREGASNNTTYMTSIVPTGSQFRQKVAAAGTGRLRYSHPRTPSSGRRPLQGARFQMEELLRDSDGPLALSRACTKLCTYSVLVRLIRRLWLRFSITGMYKSASGRIAAVGSLSTPPVASGMHNLWPHSLCLSSRRPRMLPAGFSRFYDAQLVASVLPDTRYLPALSSGPPHHPFGLASNEGLTDCRLGGCIATFDTCTLYRALSIMDLLLSSTFASIVPDAVAGPLCSSYTFPYAPFDPSPVPVHRRSLVYVLCDPYNSPTDMPSAFGVAG
ncbi:hypothetical protein C8R43DRAFT_963809 [Mycena crocata]|nr:hypothetical protein C8R43DRAFT_963809 [Mycena crocata]